MPTNSTEGSWRLRSEVLESAAHATDARAELSDDATRAVLPGVRRFLMEVEEEALLASTSPVLLAAGIPEPFSLTGVLRAWEKYVLTPVSHWFTSRFGSRLSNEHLARVMERVGKSSIPNSIYRDARQALLDAFNNKWSRAQLQEALTEAIAPTSGRIRDTAERVVRTEVTAFFNYEVLNELKRRGFAAKRWVSHHDDRVRPSHLEANGQTVPLEAAFTVGGHQLQIPGDPTAPIGETASCRCVLYGQKDSGAIVPGGWLNRTDTMPTKGDG